MAGDPGEGDRTAEETAVRAADIRPTKLKCRDTHGIVHEIVRLVGVADVLRCTEALPVYMPRVSSRLNPTTCILCLGSL